MTLVDRLVRWGLVQPMPPDHSLEDIGVAFVWVAAIVGMRRAGRTRADRDQLWRHIHDLTSALGNPPLPMTPVVLA
jgi:hypothetical protein